MHPQYWQGMRPFDHGNRPHEDDPLWDTKANLPHLRAHVPVNGDMQGKSMLSLSIPRTLRKVSLNGVVLLDDHSASEADFEYTTDREALVERGRAFFPFMQLPQEVRLQIYEWLYLMKPLELDSVSPWSPAAFHKTPRKQLPVPSMRVTPAWCSPAALAILDKIPGAITSRSDSSEDSAASPARQPSSISRAYCGLPLSILQTSKEVYYECRQLPFMGNDFAFSNGTASGLWAAKIFMTGLESWQREAMRHARLELHFQDLSWLGVGSWRELCRSWSQGLRSLRLTLMNPRGSFSEVILGDQISLENSSAGNSPHWVQSMKLLKQLRKLEVEIVAINLTNEKKLEWTRTLEALLNESKTPWDRPVQVSCVLR